MMKTFLRNCALFLVLTVLFIEGITAFLKYSGLFLKYYPGKEIYYAIEKSKLSNDSKILLLGDSVGRQLFDNTINNKQINSLACNQAVGMPGQYFLLNNYLNSENEVDQVIMLFNPLSFQNNLDQIYTYHYFLKPFYNSEYTDLFSENVNRQISKIPYHYFAQVPHIYITSWAPEFRSLDKIDYTFLSPISIEYLIKIKELSSKYSFKLNILPTPVSIESKAFIEAIDKTEFQKCNLDSEFRNYFEKIVYLDSANFEDGIHLTQPERYIEEYKKEILLQSN
ncbi:hypothetical protein VOI54_04705 [Tamlana sp. 2201CG12-4]|uniref:hypothetical protein n=1 Tax=Tamlana sp. 2201CG12-4 TaxID=3112582 RepID=UPI002DBF97EC|nr:hypothetical protein [Tamlana sp. 2201CG12-4]MEC3906305.1 hypothetical protein [Tamlana sp. 2201CG12-4]